jgi:hypothetical protein
VPKRPDNDEKLWTALRINQQKGRPNPFESLPPKQAPRSTERILVNVSYNEAS